MVALLAASLLLRFAGPAQAAGGFPLIVADHKHATYAVGETVTWNIRVVDPHLADGLLDYRITKNNSVEIAKAQVDLSDGHGAVQIKADEPGMLYGELTLKTERKRHSLLPSRRSGSSLLAPSGPTSMPSGRSRLPNCTKSRRIQPKPRATAGLMESIGR